MIPSTIYQTDHLGNNFLHLFTEIFLIRDKTTGYYILDRRSGGTYYEPEPLTKTHNPRVFFTRRAAQSFLNVWLKGTWATKVYTDYQTGETDIELTYEPVPSRIRENMEIIPASLQWSHAR